MVATSIAASLSAGGAGSSDGAPCIKWNTPVSSKKTLSVLGK